MAEGTEVGKAFVSLEANPAGLDAGLKAGEAKVQQFAVQTEKATARASGGFNRLGKSVRDTIRPITSLVGGVTAAIGTFSLFVSLGERLGRVVFGLDEKGRTKQEAAVEEGGDVVKSLLMRASGLTPLDPKVEATKEMLDKRIEEKRREIRRIAESNRAAGGPLGRQESRQAEDDLDALLEQRRAISGAELRITRLRGGSSSSFRPGSVSGLQGGDDGAVLRVLQQMQRDNQRRGVDE